MPKYLPLLLITACFNPSAKDDTSGSSSGGSSGGPSGESSSSSSESNNPTSDAAPTTGNVESSTTALPPGTTTGDVEPPTSTSTTSTSTTSSSTTSGSTSSTGTTGDPVCNNGVVEAGESCDDGNDVEGDGCKNDCTKDALFVFISKDTLAADFGALELADAFCTQAAAKGIVPPATYIAWISNSDQSVLSRMNDNPLLPYVRPDLAPIAQNLGDLLDIGTDLTAAIELDEFGELLPGGLDCRSGAVAWTGTTAGGQPTAQNCLDWTSTQDDIMATAGQAHAVNGSWSAACLAPCNQAIHIYCFEQP